MAQDDASPFERIERCEQTGRVDPRLPIGRDNKVGRRCPMRARGTIRPGTPRRIDEHPPPDRKNPTPIAAIAAKPRGVAPGPQKRLLSQIVRRIGARHPGKEAPERRLMPPDKDGKGAAVARYHAPVKGVVVVIHSS